MQSNMPNKFMEDISRLMTDAAGVAQGASREVKTALQHRMEDFLQDMDVVPREEFDMVREMAIKSQEQVQELEKRLEMLETQIASSKSE